MPAAFKFGLQPSLHNADCREFTYHPGTYGNHICIIVLLCESSTFVIKAEGTSNTFNFICSHSFTVAAATNYNAEMLLSFSNTSRSRAYVIRVIY